jgi:hypothetical protein
MFFFGKVWAIRLGTRRRSEAFPGERHREVTTMDYSDHPELVPDAMEYVEEIHRELTAENTAPLPGTEGRVVSAILADPTLRDYVRDWATRNRALEASLAPPRRVPIDDVYRRVRAMLVAAAGELLRGLS